MGAAVDWGAGVGVGVAFLNQRVYAGSMFDFIYPPSPLDKPAKAYIGYMQRALLVILLPLN